MEVIGPFLQLTLRQYVQQLVLQRQPASALSNTTTTTHPPPPAVVPMFPHLARALRQDGGMLLLMDVGDFIGCVEHNYNYTHSGKRKRQRLTTIPLFTMSYAPSCPYAFPIPSYTVLQMARAHANDDGDHQQDDDMLYPWSSKKRQAVWRGSITGLKKGKGDRQRVPRLQLAMIGNGTLEPSLDVAISCKYVSVVANNHEQRCCDDVAMCSVLCIGLSHTACTKTIVVVGMKMLND
jgi:hypothetical protein